MGAIWFEQEEFSDHLHELIGYKSGIAASIEQMCDLLEGTHYPDIILDSETQSLRIRSEDYEELYYELLYKIEATEKKSEGIFDVHNFQRKLRDEKGSEFSDALLNIYHSNFQKEVERLSGSSEKMFNPTEMMREAADKLGRDGVVAMYELISIFENLREFSPHSIHNWSAWRNIESLDNLFENKNKGVVEHGIFFDERFINFLSVNSNKLGEIHWRKFEELIAECFVKFGYQVELGPGTNDDGVDIRVWKTSQDRNTSPEYIVQCKRHKNKIDKVTVKGLYADVLHENCKMGLLITTSEFSPGARKTVAARGYQISEVNGEMINKWLKALRVPGSGILRI